MKKEETTVLKGIAIIMMYIHHLFYDSATLISENVSPVFLSNDNLIRLAAFCKSCVAIFVFISAYGITMSLKRNKDMKGYICKRYIKLMSAFLFIYLGASIVALFTKTWTSVYTGNWIANIYYCIMDAMGLANLLGTPTLNGTWWYMSYAIFIIAFIPVLNIFMDKVGIVGMLICGIFVPVYIGAGESDTFRWYMLTLILGVFTAKYDLYSKFRKFSYVHKLLVFILSLIGIVILENVRWNLGLHWLTESLIAALFPIIAIILTSSTIFRRGLSLIGKHSMNLFLTHSFIYYYYCRDYIYMWKYPLIILLVLLISTVILSAIIEKLKSLLHYSDLEKILLENN